MKQLVSGVTRLDPPAMLDPIISTLGDYYQHPVLLPPLDPDPDSNGKPSDHLIGVMRPIDTVNNKPGRVIRELRVRPLPASGLDKFGTWIQNQDWHEILNEPSVDLKAELLQNMVIEKLDEFCPTKTRRISNDDQPWFTENLRKLHRKKRREYNRNRRSRRFRRLQKLYESRQKEEKVKFKKRMIDDVMQAKSGQWYSKLKRITNYDQSKSEVTQVDEINHLSDQEQAEAIADSFSAISNEYQPVNREDIQIGPSGAVQTVSSKAP